MGTRRITRHEMKQDEFASSIGRLTIWVEDNIRLLGWGAAGAAAVVGLAFGGWIWRERGVERAEAAMAEVEGAFVAPLAGEPTASGAAETFATAAEKYRAVRERAESVIRDHGGTPAAARSRYYRALALLQAGDLSEARRALEEFIASEPDHLVVPLARRAIADIVIRQGSREEGCALLRDLTTVTSPVLPAELVLIDLAGCEAARGERAEATRLYQRVLDEFPESGYASEARSRLQDLEQGQAG